MKTRSILISLFAATLPALAQQGPQDIHSYFSPRGNCTEAIVSCLNGAQKSVLVLAYSFTSAPITKALVDAKKRGVDVQVVLDKSQRSEKYTSATFLAKEGVPTFIDSAHAIAHNKVMVIDKSTVITGSFNFTKAAEEKNAENLLVINHAPELAQTYTANWKVHRGHSEPLPVSTVPYASTSPARGLSTKASTR
jgi:phosphatidylserine/phosphatidylglycerophosphate/cardiolipin synthase-like enzyme